MMGPYRRLGGEFAETDEGLKKILMALMGVAAGAQWWQRAGVWKLQERAVMVVVETKTGK